MKSGGLCIEITVKAARRRNSSGNGMLRRHSKSDKQRKKKAIEKLRLREDKLAVQRKKISKEKKTATPYRKGRRRKIMLQKNAGKYGMVTHIGRLGDVFSFATRRAHRVYRNSGSCGGNLEAASSR